MKKFPITYLLVSLILFLFSCETSQKSSTLTIAISKERVAEHKYTDWLASTGKKFKVIQLNGLTNKEIADTMHFCHALLLTGGADVHPSMYGKDADTSRCGFIDLERDAFEKHAYETAKQLNLPVLGICRGLQYINILEGGTLFVDLPTDRMTGDLHRIGDEDWTSHEVIVNGGSLLNELSKEATFMVASNHHQGIEILAPGLKAIAFTADGLVEAFENENRSNHPFLLAVQWHPEWVDYTDPFSSKIGKLFLTEAEKYQNK
jgi:putative glutamine amidotransferase